MLSGVAGRGVLSDIIGKLIYHITLEVLELDFNALLPVLINCDNAQCSLICTNCECLLSGAACIIIPTGCEVFVCICGNCVVCCFNRSVGRNECALRNIIYRELAAIVVKHYLELLSR